MKSSEEGLSTSYQGLGIIDLGSREATMNEVESCVGEIDALLDVVDKVHFALGVGSVDEGKFDCRTGVAAVEEDSETGGGYHGRDEGFVELHRSVSGYGGWAKRSSRYHCQFGRGTRSQLGRWYRRSCNVNDHSTKMRILLP